MFSKEMNEEYQTLVNSKEKNRKKKRYFSEYYTCRGYLEDQATLIAKKYYFNLLTPQELLELKDFCSFRESFWRIRGYSPEECKNIISKIQKNNSKKKTLIPKEILDKTNPKNVKYWTHRGFSEEEAKDKISKSQSTFSLEKCIQKYGKVEGKKRWDLRQEKWQKSLQQNPHIDQINAKKDSSSFDWALQKCDGDVEEAKVLYKKRCTKKDSSSFDWALQKCDGDVEEAKVLYENRKKTVIKNSSNLYSKESVTFLSDIYDFCIDLGIKETEIFWKESEYLLKCDKGKFHLYDFTILPINVIIEYHGKAFHPKETDENWEHPYRKNTREYYLEFDKKKKMLAESCGFDFHQVWSDETEGFLEKMKIIIREKYYENGNSKT